MYNRLHFMPLIQLDSILSNGSTERCCGITMGSIALGKLGLIVNAIGLHKTLEMSPWFLESVLHFVYKGEITSL
jgi:hypothetical protein